VLGKLPEIESKRHRGSRNSKNGKNAVLSKDSNASTAYKTELSGYSKPLVKEGDEANQKIYGDGDYWEWHEKQTECLKLPVFNAPHHTSQRAFSSERRNRVIKENLDVDDADEEVLKMNRSAYPILESGKKDKDKEEQEVDPIT